MTTSSILSIANSVAGTMISTGKSTDPFIRSAKQFGFLYLLQPFQFPDHN